jgi:hypothetical protein
VAAFLKALGREDFAAVTVRGYRSDLGLFAAWYKRRFVLPDWGPLRRCVLPARHRKSYRRDLRVGPFPEIA